LHEDVALAHQPQRQCAVVGVPEVQVGVLLAEGGFDVEAQDVVQVRIPVVDHVGPVFREQFADRRPGDDVREVEDAQPLQGPPRAGVKGVGSLSVRRTRSIGGTPASAWP
jgi:hypothetical protein